MADPGEPNGGHDAARSPGDSSPLLYAARVLVLIGGLSLAAMGVFVGSIGILASFLEPDSHLLLITVSVSLLALTVGLGMALAWQAWRSIRGHSSGWFRPRLVGALGLTFPLALVLGYMVLQLDWLPSLTFPPLHVLAAVLPSILIVALVARSLGDTARRRDVVLQLSSGALVATTLAFTLEIAVILAILVILLASVVVQPNGLEQVQDLVNRLQDPAWMEEPSQFLDLFRSPLILSVVFLLFSVLVPLIEEAVKTVGVPLRAYRRPEMAQAFLWGLAGGAGFALAEGLFNSLGSLDTWAAIITLRVGATLLHCLTGALMGLAWYHALLERRWAWGLGIYALSASIHGLWNALVAGMAIATLRPQVGRVPILGQITDDLGASMIFGVLVILAFAVAICLVGLTHYVRGRTGTVERVRMSAAPSTTEMPQEADTPRESS
jgi:hypothetical protein